MVLSKLAFSFKPYAYLFPPTHLIQVLLDS